MKRKRTIRAQRGSAIIMALVTMMLLLLLGLAVATVSMGTLNNNATDAFNNEAYYAAESAVTGAIAQLKYEVSAYYNRLLEANGSDYPALFSNFFPGINGNAQTHFSEPQFDGITTYTTFTAGEYDDDESRCEFLISSTAIAADGSQYRVSGKVYVKKVDVSVSQGVWLEIDGSALKAGGILKLGNSDGVGVSGGNVIISALARANAWQASVSGGSLVFDPGTAGTINDCVDYPSYGDPAMGTVNLYCATATTVNASNMPAEPVSITTASGVSLTVSSCTVPSGVIYGRGNTTITNCDVKADVYSDGNLSVTNQTIEGDIHCRGNLTINNATVTGDVYCDGSVTFNSAYLKGSIFAGGAVNMNNGSTTGSLYAAGAITVSSASIVEGVVYSHTKIYAGNMSATAVFFSGGDIEITGGMSIRGAIIARNDIFFTNDSGVWLNVTYSGSVIEDIMTKESNAPLFSGRGKPELNEEVFMGESITPEGRG
jgi:Protein of unknown function, DUF583.